MAPSREEYLEIEARNRLSAAKDNLNRPKIDILKLEAKSLKDAIDPDDIRNRRDFIKQFEDALSRARRFADIVFPE